MSLREEFRYYIAKNLYLIGKYDQASNFTNGITYKNRLYLGAQYLQGSIQSNKTVWMIRSRTSARSGDERSGFLLR
ncbi:MAG: hypothetical protein R2877_02280 [Bdellovibrionota bacterium]